MQLGKRANTLVRSFFMNFQVGLGDEEESGTLTKTSLVFSYGGITADARPALSLQWWPYRAISCVCQRGGLERCRSIKIHFGKCCQLAI